MAGVTDLVFRRIVRKVDPTCLMSTEMVSSRSLMYKPENQIMQLDQGEHPVGIQIFGHEPDVMAQAAVMAEARGADFLDINMGCPVPKLPTAKMDARSCVNLSLLARLFARSSLLSKSQ